jgi:hypothetical protein
MSRLNVFGTFSLDSGRAQAASNRIVRALLALLALASGQFMYAP